MTQVSHAVCAFCAACMCRHMWRNSALWRLCCCTCSLCRSRGSSLTVLYVFDCRGCSPKEEKKGTDLRIHSQQFWLNSSERSWVFPLYGYRVRDTADKRERRREQRGQEDSHLVLHHAHTTPQLLLSFSLFVPRSWPFPKEIWITSEQRRVWPRCLPAQLSITFCGSHLSLLSG